MKKSFLLLCFAAVFIAGCKKDKHDAPVTTTPPATTGNITGTVSQYSQFGATYTTGLNTTTVSIDSTNISCITDQNGHYALPNMSTGMYTLVFKKPGCGTIKLQDISYKFSDTVTYNAKIADIPTFFVSNAYLKDTTWFTSNLPGIYYNAGTSPFNSKATLVAIVGKSANMSLADPESYLNDGIASLVSTTDYNRFLSYFFLRQSYQFQKDSLIFMKIYPVAATGAGYIDNRLNKFVYTAYGPPYTTLSITMPQ